jgi:hypothetical protein
MKLSFSSKDIGAYSLVLDQGVSGTVLDKLTLVLWQEPPVQGQRPLYFCEHIRTGTRGLVRGARLESAALEVEGLRARRLIQRLQDTNSRIFYLILIKNGIYNPEAGRSSKIRERRRLLGFEEVDQGLARSSMFTLFSPPNRDAHSLVLLKYRYGSGSILDRVAIVLRKVSVTRSGVCARNAGTFSGEPLQARCFIEILHSKERTWINEDNLDLATFLLTNADAGLVYQYLQKNRGRDFSFILSKNRVRKDAENENKRSIL